MAWARWRAGGAISGTMRAARHFDVAVCVCARHPAAKHRVDPGYFRTSAAAVAQIDLVDDFRDRAHRRIVQPEGPDHRLKRAWVPAVAERTLAHVEGDLVRVRGIRVSGSLGTSRDDVQRDRDRIARDKDERARVG